MEDVGIFYGHLVYFRPNSILYSCFGMLEPRKIWQPNLVIIYFGQFFIEEATQIFVLFFSAIKVGH
jgi:hypothetical protein